MLQIGFISDEELAIVFSSLLLVIVLCFAYYQDRKGKKRRTRKL